MIAASARTLHLLSSFLSFALLLLPQETTKLHDGFEGLVSDSVGHRHTHLRQASYRKGNTDPQMASITNGKASTLHILDNHDNPAAI